MAMADWETLFRAVGDRLCLIGVSDMALAFVSRARNGLRPDQLRVAFDLSAPLHAKVGGNREIGRRVGMGCVEVNCAKAH